MNVNRQLSRRQFLSQSATLATLAGTGFAGSLLPLAAASAQGANDYKALVCVFLFGGNDQSNTVVPYSGSAYTAYQNARPTLALPQASLLPLNLQGHAGPALALNPALTPFKTLFDQGRMSLVANVGTLVGPITQTQWNRGRPTAAVPFQLFSHSDQQGIWQTGIPDGQSRTGWLGRMGDLLSSTHNPNSGVSITMSLGGNAVMLAGNQTIQYQLNSQGAVRVNALNTLYSQSQGAAALRQMMTGPRTHLMEGALTQIGARAIATEGLVNGAIASVNPSTAFPSTGIGQQLRMVSRLIGARAGLGQKRQIFFVQQGGYDFHDNLLNDQFSRLSELAEALSAFDSATRELGVSQNVTTFTASEFGRALQHNGRGSDHGWGGHQFVMGGAVQGNRVVGSFPDVALGSSLDAGQGRLIPTTAVDQLAASFGSWMGVPDSELNWMLPNLSRFATRTLPLFV